MRVVPEEAAGRGVGGSAMTASGTIFRSGGLDGVAIAICAGGLEGVAIAICAGGLVSFAASFFAGAAPGRSRTATSFFAAGSSSAEAAATFLGGGAALGNSRSGSDKLEEASAAFSSLSFPFTFARLSGSASGSARYAW